MSSIDSEGEEYAPQIGFLDILREERRPLYSTIANTLRDPLRLSFNNLTKEYVDIHTRKTEKILDNISGSITPGKLTAIIGPRREEPYALLMMLCGHLLKGSYSGQILHNDQVRTPKQLRQSSGVVFHRDVLPSKMTVMEAMEMSSQLRTPAFIAKGEREQRIEDTLTFLNIHHLKNTRLIDLGSHLNSEGAGNCDIKRVIMAMELILDPPIIFLEEPTTNMDCISSYGFLKTVKQLTKKGKTVVCSLCTISSPLYRILDDLLVLDGGAILYHGPADEAIDYFRSLGFPCPTPTNPADYILRCVMEACEGAGGAQSLPYKWQESKYKFERKSARMRSKASALPLLTASMSMAGRRPVMVDDRDFAEFYPIIQTAPFHLQFYHVFRRTMIETARTRRVLFFRAFNVIFAGVVFGLFYGSIKPDRFYLKIRNKAAAICLMTYYLYSVNGASALFINDRELFKREYPLGYYSVSAYFWGRFLAEVPLTFFFPYIMIIIAYYMIGFDPAFSSVLYAATFAALAALGGLTLGILLCTFVHDRDIFLLVGWLMTVPFFIFTGILIDSRTVPSYLAWLKYTSTYHYAFNGMMEIEFGRFFDDCQVDEGRQPDCPIAELILLEILDVNINTPSGVNLALSFAALVGALLLAYFSQLAVSWWRHRNY